MNRKKLRVTITLNGNNQNGEQKVFESEYNQIASSELRVSATIVSGNGALSPTAKIQVYGLSLTKMLALFRVQWNTLDSMLNEIQIEAGEEGKPFELVYKGNITTATINMDSAPDPFLDIDSVVGLVEQMKPAEPLAIVNEVDVAEVVRIIADNRMGFDFQNDGVSHIIPDGFMSEGANLETIRQLAHDYDFDLYIEHKLIAIAPRNTRREIPIPVITPTGGLEGYPAPDIKGISFKCFYNPLVRFGGNLEVKDSIIEVCNGIWRVYGLKTILESGVPNGRWSMEVNATWANSTDAVRK